MATRRRREQLWDEAEAFVQQRKFDQALPLFRSLANDDVPGAALAVATCYESLASPELAWTWYAKAAKAGDPEGVLQLAFRAREQGKQKKAMTLARKAAKESALARAVVAVWKWVETANPALESELLAGIPYYESARSSLAALLVMRGETDAARALLEEGRAAGELDCLVPLGNLLIDHYDDEQGARQVWREALERGDINAGQNLVWLVDGRRGH